MLVLFISVISRVASQEYSSPGVKSKKRKKATGACHSEADLLYFEQLQLLPLIIPLN